MTSSKPGHFITQTSPRLLQGSCPRPTTLPGKRERSAREIRRHRDGDVAGSGPLHTPGKHRLEPHAIERRLILLVVPLVPEHRGHHRPLAEGDHPGPRLVPAGAAVLDVVEGAVEDR